MKKFALLIAILFCLGFTSMAKTVTGTVTDSYGPIPGICVVVKGTSTGTVTDLDGNYEIECDNRDILVFSGIGYVTQEIRVGARSVIDVVMVFDEDVIVVTPENAPSGQDLSFSLIRKETCLEDKLLNLA